MLRRTLCSAVGFALIVSAIRIGGAEASVADYSRVTVAPTKTSIYVGTVSMTMPTFTRNNDSFESTYSAKVFPYFFYNEAGRLTVDISSAALRQLEQGEPIEFKGRAIRNDGAERRVEGKATPIDSATGKLKVRVFYSKRIELIFNTTYQFPVSSGARPSSKTNDPQVK